jgi:hypothetical protein
LNKQAGYDYINRSTNLENKKSTFENISRERMSCCWNVVPFLLFFGKYIDKKYDISLTLNLDETSVSQTKTINQLFAVPSSTKDIYIPLIYLLLLLLLLLCSNYLIINYHLFIYCWC